MRLSPSKINTYMKCPREFYYKYIAKIPEKKTIHLFRGTLVHQVLEDLFKKKFRTLSQWEKGGPAIWVQDQFEKGWEEKIAKHKWLWEVHTKEEMDSMYTETEELLQNFVSSVNKKLGEMVHWKIFKTNSMGSENQKMLVGWNGKRLMVKLKPLPGEGGYSLAKRILNSKHRNLKTIKRFSKSRQLLRNRYITFPVKVIKSDMGTKFLIYTKNSPKTHLFLHQESYLDLRSRGLAFCTSLLLKHML